MIVFIFLFWLLNDCVTAGLCIFLCVLGVFCFAIMMCVIMGSVRKEDIVISVRNRTGLDERTIRDVLNAFVEVVALCLQSGGTVRLNGFGLFYTKTRKFFNPLDPSDVKPDRRFLHWRASPSLTQKVHEMDK